MQISSRFPVCARYFLRCRAGLVRVEGTHRGQLVQLGGVRKSLPQSGSLAMPDERAVMPWPAARNPPGNFATSFESAATDFHALFLPAFVRAGRCSASSHPSPVPTASAAWHRAGACDSDWRPCFHPTPFGKATDSVRRDHLNGSSSWHSSDSESSQR